MALGNLKRLGVVALAVLVQLALREALKLAMRLRRGAPLPTEARA